MPVPIDPTGLPACSPEHLGLEGRATGAAKPLPGVVYLSLSHPQHGVNGRQVDVEGPPEPDHAVVVAFCWRLLCLIEKLLARLKRSASSLDSIDWLISGRRSSSTSARSRTAWRLSSMLEPRRRNFDTAVSIRVITLSCSVPGGMGAFSKVLNASGARSMTCPCASSSNPGSPSRSTHLVAVFGLPLVAVELVVVPAAVGVVVVIALSRARYQIV